MSCPLRTQNLLDTVKGFCNMVTDTVQTVKEGQNEKDS